MSNPMTVPIPFTASSTCLIFGLKVVRQLRERNEPIRLFGESDYQAYERLKKLTMSMPEVNKGFKNDFKMAMDAVDQDYLTEMLASGSKEMAEDKIEVAVKK